MVDLRAGWHLSLLASPPAFSSGPLHHVTSLTSPLTWQPCPSPNPLSSAGHRLAPSSWQAWKCLGVCYLSPLSLCMTPLAPSASDSALLLPPPFPRHTFHVYLYLREWEGHLSGSPGVSYATGASADASHSGSPKKKPQLLYSEC